VVKGGSELLADSDPPAALRHVEAQTSSRTSTFPASGDICYSEVIPEPHHRYLVYNDTSPHTSDPPWGPARRSDRSWSTGGGPQLLRRI